MSINYLPAVNLITHWEAVCAGAKKAGRPVPSRSSWRIAREVYVAKTDQEARDHVLNGPIAAAYTDYMYNILRSLGAVDLYKDDPDMPDEALTAEYVCDKIWIDGSPDTVASKLEKLYNDVGGFGTVLQIQYTYEPFQQWKDNMQLFAREVMPGLKHLVPEETTSVAAQ